MTKIIKFISAGVLMSALCITLAACNELKDQELQGEDVPFTEYALEKIAQGEAFSARWVNLDYNVNNYKGNILVINSDEELKKYVEGEYPVIDFSQKTLVLAYGYNSGTTFGYDGLKFQQVSEGNYVMTTNGMATALTVMIHWQVAIVVDKLPSKSNIKLNTVIVNLP